MADVAATAGATALLEGGTASTGAQPGPDGGGAELRRRLGRHDRSRRRSRSVSTTTRPGPSPTAPSRPARCVRRRARRCRTCSSGIFGSRLREQHGHQDRDGRVHRPRRGGRDAAAGVGDCHFPELSSCFATSGCLPRLSQVPSTSDNTGWTSFLDGSDQREHHRRTTCRPRAAAPRRRPSSASATRSSSTTARATVRAEGHGGLRGEEGHHQVPGPDRAPATATSTSPRPSRASRRSSWSPSSPRATRRASPCTRSSKRCRGRRAAAPTAPARCGCYS